MLSKRVIIVARDRVLAKVVGAGAMAAGGATEIVASVDDLAPGRIEADLILYFVEALPDPRFSTLLGRIRIDTPVVVLVPSADLRQYVDLMHEPRIAHVLTAEALTPAAVSTVASRILYGDVFGIEKLLPHGVRVYSVLVGDYQEKAVAISALSDFAAAMGVRRKHREGVERAADEMLMNALYDAPVDAQGRPLFTEIPTKTRISLRVEQKVVMQYACDGSRFVVSVRDSFGSLRKETVLKYLHKCLHSDQQIDRKAGGAGLGLYLIANSATELLFNVYPGVATEVICGFDLQSPRLQLRQLGVFHERIDAVGPLASIGRKRLVSGSHPTVAAGAAPRWRLPAAAAAALVALAVVGALAWPRLAPRAATAALDVATAPPGAQVFVNGRAVGYAPLRIGALTPGRAYTVRAERAGFELAERVVAADEREQRVELVLQARRATLHVTSQPRGALLLVDGKDSGQVTPATLSDLIPEQRVTLALQLPGHAPWEQTIETPHPGEQASFAVQLDLLADWGMLELVTEPAGARALLNGLELPGRTPIAEHVVRAGRYLLSLRAEGRAPWQRELEVRGREREKVSVKLVEGGALTLRGNRAARVLIEGRPVGALPLLEYGLAVGMYQIRVVDERAPLFADFRVEVRPGKTVTRDLAFGTVEVRADGVMLRPPSGLEATRVALLAGPQRLRLINKLTGEERDETVTIAPAQTVVIDRW